MLVYIMIGLPGALPQAANECCALGAKRIPPDDVLVKILAPELGVISI